jgi:hypothetical protein
MSFRRWLLLAFLALARSHDVRAANEPTRPIRSLIGNCLLAAARMVSPDIAKSTLGPGVTAAISNESLYQGFIAARALHSTAAINPQIVATLMKLFRCSEAELLSSEVGVEGLGYFAQKLGAKKIDAISAQMLVANANDLSAMNVWAPESARTMREVLGLARLNDARNMNRGWGTMLLPVDDIAFREPGFLRDIVISSGVTGQGMSLRDPARASFKFKDEWKLSAPPNTHVRQFYLTGSDANNSLGPVANAFAQMAYKDPSIDNALVVPLRGSWVAGRGSGDKSNFRFQHNFATPQRPVLTAPYVDEFGIVLTGDDLAGQLAAETYSLNELRQLFADPQIKVGAILLEPVLGPAGVKFFRPEYLIKLRALCDELGIAIVADEILTGGGRTGKFFAYQHYQGFEPDFITFGKGLIVSGIAEVERKHPNYPPHFLFRNEVTLDNYVEPLLKSAAVMKRIREGRLVENAADVGAFFYSDSKTLKPAAPMAPHSTRLVV